MNQWLVFDALHPLPDRLVDLHHGALMSAIVNITRSADAAPALPADFFFHRDPEPLPKKTWKPASAKTVVSEADRLRALWEGR